MNFYRSGFEGQIADDLRSRGVAFEYEKEVLDYTSAVRGGECMECGCKKVGKKRKYTPDYVIQRGCAGPLYIEAKGRFPSTDRSKMRDVQRAHPDKDIRILFQKSSKAQEAALRKWCNKFKFVCAFGYRVPDEWL